jgi:hypothetical protein
VLYAKKKKFDPEFFIKVSRFKGLSREMDLAFDDTNGQFRSK